MVLKWGIIYNSPDKALNYNNKKGLIMQELNSEKIAKNIGIEKIPKIS